MQVPVRPSVARALPTGKGFVSPTSDELLSALLSGPQALDRQRARFRILSAAECVPRLVMQAIDPLLLKAILGPELAERWVPLLERYYADARRASPAIFRDVGAAWRLQRRRWLPLVAAEGAGVSPAAPPADSVEPSRGPDRAAAARAPRAAGARGGRRGASPRGVYVTGVQPVGPLQVLAASAVRPVAASSPGVVVDGDQPVPLVDEADEPSEPVPLPEASLDPPSDPALARRDMPPGGSAPPRQATPKTGVHGVALLAAARRAHFDLVSVFDGCLSDGDPGLCWETFRFGGASLSRSPGRPR